MLFQTTRRYISSLRPDCLVRESGLVNASLYPSATRSFAAFRCASKSVVRCPVNCPGSLLGGLRLFARERLPLNSSNSQATKGSRKEFSMSSMQRALRMLRPQLKGVAEKLFPKTMTSRRFHSWQKVEPELPLLPALCRKDAVALDIGANEGFFVHHLLPLARSVIVFEPLPQMLARLREKYTGKMEIHGVILSDQEGQGELRYPAGGYMSATVAESNSAAQESGRDIETVVAPKRRLDSFDL